MRYMKTVDLWDNDSVQSIRNGQLKLQTGQWVVCGNYEHKSRYVDYIGGVFIVAHWEGKKDSTRDAFKRYVESRRTYKQNNKGK